MNIAVTNMRPEFMTGGAETGGLMRDLDWNATPLGDPRGWSPTLKALVGVMLGSRQPMLIVWGPERTTLYNDGYAAMCGAKHPRALGRPFDELWSEIWEFVEPILSKAFAGEATHMDDIRFVMERNGHAEEAFFAFGYTPVRNEDGEVAGMFCTCTETTARVRAEREATAERERLEALFVQAPSFMAMLGGPEHVFERINPAYQQLVGHRDLVGMNVRDALPELGGQGFYELLDQVYDTGVAFRGEALPILLQRTPGGASEERYVDFVYQPITDATGRVTGIFVDGSDVTDRRETEKALRDSEEFNRRILASSTDCIKVLDIDGNLAFMSEGGMRVMEVSDFNAIAGCPWPDFWEGEGHVEAKAAVASAREGRPAHFQGAANTMAGHSRWWDVRVSPILGPDGTPERILSVSRDVTETRRATEALRTLNETLEQRIEQRTQERDRIWQVSRDMLGVADVEGGWISVNPAWTRILGWTSDEIVGRTSEWLEHPDDRSRTRAEISRLAAGGTTPTLAYENRFRTKDGAYRHLSWNAALVEGQFYTVARDVTDDKARAASLLVAEESLRQSQKLEAVGQLTGGVAHDFNNLLTVIKSSTDLLKRPNLPEDRRARYVGAISDTVDRAAKLTGQLLAFARRQALKPEVFDAGTSVRAIADMVGTLMGARIRVAIRLPEEPCYINADPSQFDTALVNMAVNARDAMDGEGLLTIKVRAVTEMPSIRSHPGHDGDFVAVEIADTGTGIPADRLERIFEPFFTTKGVGQGTGLGLSQVFGFAKQSDGEVLVESEVGTGTTFTLFLPRSMEAPEPSEDLDAAATIEGHGTCVLVVEDNHDVGTFATQTLAELGYGTHWVASGKEALAELSGSPGAHHVVFSDVVMPGMSGLELGKEIKRLYPDLPVVLTSGYSHVLAKDGSHGFELLRKPYSVEALSRVLHTAIRRRRRRRSPAAMT